MIGYWSEEDDSFIIEVTELPSFTADGVMYQEAVANAEIIVAEWIETVLGCPVPGPKSCLLSV